jgi:hypothetical protein
MDPIETSSLPLSIKMFLYYKVNNFFNVLEDGNLLYFLYPKDVIYIS